MAFGYRASSIIRLAFLAWRRQTERRQYSGRREHGVNKFRKWLFALTKVRISSDVIRTYGC